GWMGERTTLHSVQAQLAAMRREVAVRPSVSATAGATATPIATATPEATPTGSTSHVTCPAASSATATPPAASPAYPQIESAARTSDSRHRLSNGACFRDDACDAVTWIQFTLD